jgi:hypothetical protein
MATTKNYLPLADHLNIYNSTYDRVDAAVYPTSWQALNATMRVTDNPLAILDIDYYSLEIMPTNAGQVTLYINNVPISDSKMVREMLFHAQVKSSVDVDTSVSLFETGQPMGTMLPHAKQTTRDQFVTIRSNIWPLQKESGARTATIEIELTNHSAQIIYLTIPAVVNHLDFYKNSVVRSARTVIPDAYWRIDLEQSDPSYPMYKLLDTLTNSSNDVMQLFSNWFDHELSELAPGLTGDETWAKSTLTDPSLANDGNMDWLSQFTGSELKGNITGTAQPSGTTRDFYTTTADIQAFLKWQLENSYYGRGAGTREAMTSAVQQVLSGGKNVAILPHFGAHAWKIQVQTLRSETQDFDASTFSSDDVLDAVAEAAPMGYEIFHMAVLFFAFTLGNVGLGRLGLGVLGGPGGYVPPDAPTGLTISAGGTPSTELTLTWVAPVYNGGDAVSAYLIRRDGSIIVANTGNTNLTYTDTGRSPGTAYSYTVEAINQAGAGDPSNSASGTTDPIVSDAPTSLTASAGATPSSMINLSWTAPAYTGGAAIVGYQITENRAGAGDVVLVSNTGSTATTYARTGLDRVVSYTYKVAAINSAGVGANSNTATLTTAAELPGPPTALTLTAGSPAMTVISLSWTAPTETGGAAITGYQIKKNGSIVVADTGTTGTTYSATGLTAGQTYTFAVAAINSAGAGGDSNVPSLTTSGPIHATGGTITEYGNYIIHTFLTGGTFSITENDRSDTFDVLIVGGGAGGGMSSSGFTPSTTIAESAAGGGGGGGVRAETGQTGTVAAYTVIVGQGGAAGTGSGADSSPGGESAFGSLNLDATNAQGGASANGGAGTGNGGNAAAGGGGGAGAWFQGGVSHNQSQGGSLGGTGGGDYNYGGDGGDADSGTATLSGGTLYIATSGGGGGSYGNDGDDGVVNYGSSQGGDGGDGQANDWQTGSTQYYGGGGGGSVTAGNTSVGANWNTYPQAQGGSGGGGGGGVTYEDANDNWQIIHVVENGTDGLGGGGGGSAWGGGTSGQPGGGLGGSGIVVIRYAKT